MIEADAFAHLLAQGLGRAVRYLDDHAAAPYRAVILEACLRNTAYLPQYLGDRGTYLLDVIERIGDRPFYRDRILAALLTATDAFDVDQLCDLARLFAAAGDAAARDALYAKFRRNNAEEPWAGAEAVIALDGLDGFLVVAQRIGAAVLEAGDEQADSRPLLFANGRFGAELVRQALAAFQTHDCRIDAYAAALEREQAAGAARRAARVDVASLSYDELRGRIAEQGRALGRVRPAFWGERASSEALASAARDLLAEQSPDRLSVYLRIFSRRPYPGPLDRLLELTHHPDSEVVTAALLALRLHASPAVRALALEWLDAPETPPAQRAQSLWLLEANFAAGDYGRIERVLDGVDRYDAHEYHDLEVAALDVCEAHPEPAAASPLLALYEYGPCAWCRERAVTLLHAMDALPAWLRAECRFDANLELRVKVRQFDASTQDAASAEGA